MSRIGNRQLTIPAEVKVELKDGLVLLTSSKGELIVKYNKHYVNVELTDNLLTTKKANNAKNAKMQYGTINSHLANAIEGLTKGFSKNLKIEGVGYRAALTGTDLKLSLGYTHPIVLKVPTTVSIVVPNPTEIHLSSFNKELLGQFAAEIRKYRPPEPYKGKGVAYVGEYIHRKVGKTSEGGKK